jgi:benzylsuccinate CoA-transferase BbsF subunit
MPGALEGLKIADFSWVGAGPRATKDLADNGATVIKIESRERLDLGRLSPPFKASSKDPDGSAFFAQTNTSKRSVTLNLRHPGALALAKRLVAWSDIVFENFSFGYMERIGLGYEDLKAIKPDIIMVSVSATGRTGPLAQFRGYGNAAGALSGHAALSGWPDRPPHLPPFAYGDVIAPLFAVIATLAAVEHKQRTGKGQHVDVSQFEPMVHVIGDVVGEFSATGKALKRANRSERAAPHGVYPCAGADNWIAIACPSDESWRMLAAAMAAPQLATDKRFASLDDRKQNEDALDALIADWTRGQDKSELTRQLCEAGIAAGAVQNGKEVFDDPQLAALGHFVALDHPVLGASAMPASPFALSGTPGAVTRSPLLGEHNREVFIDMLGLPEAEFDALVADGALR